MNNTEWNKLLQEVDAEVKKTNGHDYVHILKTRCMNCGRSPNQKGICRNWFQYFLSVLESKLTGKGIIE